MEERGHIVETWIKIGSILLLIIIILFGIFDGGPKNAESNLLNVILIRDIAVHEVLLFLLLGFVSGTVSGLLGMGGGVLKITNLHFIMGFEILFARIISLLSYIVISISAFLAYRKYKLILWNVVKMLIPSAVLGAIIGVIIGNYINKNYIEIILGIYALFTGVIVINQIWVRPSEEEIAEIPSEELNETAVSAIGVGMGVISSLIGISGGILSTPMQQSILKLPLKNSIANTVTAAIFCSFVAAGFILVNGLKNGDYSLFSVLLVTICLIPGSYAGGQFGSYLTHILPLNLVRVIFAITTFVIGFSILILNILG